jgi:hypothetical protein
MTPITFADWKAGRLRGFNFYAANQDFPPPEDFTALAETGANHARVWLVAQWTGSAYEVDAEQLQRMDDCLDSLAAVGVSAVIVLSIDQAQQPWGSAQRGLALAVLWGSLSARWPDSRPVVAAFDLLNEPAPPPAGPAGWTPEQDLQVAAEWPGIALLCARYIRIHAPGRVIVYEVGRAADPSEFKGDPLPLDGIVYSTHIYRPHGVTHQGTQEWNAGSRAFTIGRSFDAQAGAELEAAFDQVLAAFPGQPVYFGEFGCANWVPGCAAYMAAVASLCIEDGINFAAHAFRQWQGFDYEAVPDGRATFIRSSTTPAMKVLRAAFTGQPLPVIPLAAPIASTPEPIKVPPTPAPEPAPMTPVPDPLPATPAPPVASPAPAPAPAGISADVRELVRAADERITTLIAAYDRYNVAAVGAVNAQTAALRETHEVPGVTRRQIAAEWMAQMIVRQIDADSMAATVQKYMATLDRLYPEG